MPHHKKKIDSLRLSIAVMVFILAAIYCRGQDRDNRYIQTKRCPVKTINYSQGLMNNFLTGIITDASGFTWVSTSTGLQRYNGYTLQTISPVAEGDTIAINYPVHFMEGPGDRILIGYRNGILEYGAGNNTFKKLIRVVSSAPSRYALMPLTITNEGIWCFEEGKGVMVYNKSGVASASFPGTRAANIEDMLRTEGYNITRKIVAVNQDYIFIRVSPNRILQIELRTHQTKTIEYPGAGIIGIECDKDKVFVASPDGLGSFRIRDGYISKKFLYKALMDYPVNRSSVALTGANRLLVTVEKRLYEFDTSCHLRKEIVSLNHEPLLKAGYIQIEYEDRFHRIWLLTHEDIRRIQDTETPFGQYIFPKEKDNFVRCLYYDKEKNILLAGAYGGAIQLYDSSGNTLWDKPLSGVGLQFLLSIEKLSDDHYLLVTQGRGLYILRLREKQISPLDLNSVPVFQSAILQNTYSSNLQRVDDSRVCIAATANVFSCHIAGNQIIEADPLLKDSMPKLYGISCFILATNKTLWVSIQPGVILQTGASGARKEIKIPENYVVRCMAEDGHQHIWIGTERGIFIYDAEGKLIKHLNRESGLLNDFIYSLQPADSSCNNFFASTNFGLSYVSGEGKIKNYTRELGLQENEFNTQAGTVSPTGKLFFAGINGITAFYPSSLSGSGDSSFISITRLVVNDSLYTVNGGEWKGDSLQLAYNQNHIQFDIAATGLLDPTEYLYKYRLAGFEKLWQTTTQATGIRYTLQPGRYTLEIDCSPVLYSGNEYQKKIVFIIDPPFWKTWWFISLLVLLGALIIFGTTYFILRQRYQSQSRKLEMKQQLVNERERISRELHDNIGSQLSYISNNIDWLAETPKSFSKEEETKRLGIVNETAKNLVADLRETIWAMKKESIMLDELSDKLKSFLQSQCILQPQLEVTINEAITKNYNFSPVVALNIFRSVQEAIVNSIRHSKATNILFSIESGNEIDFSFTVQDNGTGFDPQKKYNEHYGLENMQHRTKESGARLFIVSAPGEGTKLLILKSALGPK